MRCRIGVLVLAVVAALDCKVACPLPMSAHASVWTEEALLVNGEQF